MRLPGTRYQEHGWEHVRKLLGQCSLAAFKQCDMRQMLAPAGSAELLDWYVDAVAAALRRVDQSARAEVFGNSYGESVLELSLSLVYELQAQPACWQGLTAAVAGEHQKLGAFWEAAGADGALRKKVNDMYAGLRDKVDADNYQVTTGRACSPNKIYTYRMLDTAYHHIAALFAAWRQHQEQVAAILGRPLDGAPIEVRQMKSIAGCKAEWIIRWSESQQRFSGAAGPLHTRSKRFASLKNSPEKIAAMLAEIGDYEELSANMDSADEWQGDAGEATAWLEDYWRVLSESEARSGADADGDRILAAPDDEFAALERDDDAARPAPAGEEPAAPPSVAARNAGDEAVALGVSLPPRFIELAGAAQDSGSRTLILLKNESLAIRLAVYQKMLGSADDSYPDAWCDPVTGELPTLQQLAALDRISMPTLRKRRNEAIARLQAACAGAATSV